MTTAAKGAVALKSIAAYRSGLEINPNVTEKDAEEALSDLLNGQCISLRNKYLTLLLVPLFVLILLWFAAGKPVRITNKDLIDYVFVLSLLTATSLDLPMQIHTG